MKFFSSLFFSGLFLLLLNKGCKEESQPPVPSTDKKLEMRNFVEGISAFAKKQNPAFILVTQNGLELLTVDGLPDGAVDDAYKNSIDGVSEEHLFYGEYGLNTPTPPDHTRYWISFLDIAKKNNLPILITDYCAGADLVDSSYTKNKSLSYISFAADRIELDQFPVYSVQARFDSTDIKSLHDVNNFLYLLDYSRFNSRTELLDALKASNYDLFILDAFFNDGTPFTPDEINSLKMKHGGQRRIVLSYFSIGEAEDYRNYWDEEWYVEPPAWLRLENKDWKGNYEVFYWDKNWQNIIYGTPNSYCQQILNEGFDGVFLDKVDAFDNF
jgi:cysteinyl-tRNA synthetase